MRLAWIAMGLVWIALAPLPAGAQSNLDAGKTPAQIFSHTCNACHRSPRELRPTSSAYLRDHYTAGPREAAAMAAYVASIGSDPEAVKQRRPPALGAGRDPPADPASRTSQTTPAANRDAAGDGVMRPPEGIPLADQTGRPDVQAALPSTPSRRMSPGGGARPLQNRAASAVLRPRRPADSIEGAQPSSDVTGTFGASTEAIARPPALDPFEE